MVAILFLGICRAQEAPPAASDPAKMEQTLKEAGDLQSTQPQGVAEKLTPLLTELRQLRQKSALTAATSRIYQEALLLLMRTQAMLLAPEPEIMVSFRELLVLNPKIEDGIFNPREKLTLDKVRSAETGRLSLQTNPAGCTLTYLGVEMGVTPADIPLVAGSYPLVLRKQGYLDQEFEVTVKSSEILTVSRTLRRRAVDIPLSVSVPGTSISVNGQQIGTSQPYSNWIASLPAEKQQDVAALVQQWKVDMAAASFFRIAEVPVGETIKIEFRAPCYEALTLSVSIPEQDVDWIRPILARPELRFVELKRDTGFVEITSTPPGAEVWIDGAVQGKTPLGRDLCSGSHRVQVLHRSGQYVREVIVRRGQAAKVNGDLKPAIAFLGVYSLNPQNNSLSVLAQDWEIVSRRLSLRLTAFSDPQVSAEEIESLRKKGNLAIERLIDPKTSPSDTDLLAKRAATDAGRSDLILLGLRSGDKYLFRLYSTIHSTPDIIEVANLEEASLDFLISQLNKAEWVASRLQIAGIGIDLLESPKGLVVMKPLQAPVAANVPVAPGTFVRAVDQKTMGFKELNDYLHTKKAGQSIAVDFVISKDNAATAQVPVRISGAEYPWSTPDGFTNSVLAMLIHLIERDPLANEAKFASLGLARGLMRQGEWKLALEYLAKTNLEPHKTGVCPGTVLYYQGRCYEELGDRALAESYYARTKDFPEATLGTPDGLSIPGLAERRIQALKKK